MNRRGLPAEAVNLFLADAALRPGEAPFIRRLRPHERDAAVLVLRRLCRPRPAVHPGEFFTRAEE